MISIIICSRDPEALKGLSKNIDQTIRVPYEIIPVDNTMGKFGICEAYNIGAAKSQYPYLCFIHEDILFRSQQWGNVLIKLLEDQSIGLVGVAGATYKAATASAWWDTDTSNYCINIIHPVEDSGLQKVSLNPTKEAVADVVTVDGVLMATRKEVWQKYKFDQKSLRGFHFYDTDFSTSIQTAYRVVVTYEILIEHFSKGSPNTLAWLESAFIYHRKWKNRLPLSVHPPGWWQEIRLKKIAAYNTIHRSRMLSFPIHALLKEVFMHNKFPQSIFFLLFYLYFLLTGKLKE